MLIAHSESIHHLKFWPRNILSNDPTQSAKAQADFAQQAQEQSPGIVREFLQFLVENKKWWLIPILVAVGLIALLVALSASPVSVFIYPLF